MIVAASAALQPIAAAAGAAVLPVPDGRLIEDHSTDENTGHEDHSTDENIGQYINFFFGLAQACISIYELILFSKGLYNHAKTYK
jgi:hypothetical protein